jgi:SAM-dependent methyltransferase
MNQFTQVLDVCCGGRHFWFDKNDERAFFLDKRIETIFWGGKQRPGRCPTIINPDCQSDFTALPFPENTFSLVVFDPPHGFFGKTGIMAKTYGILDDNWKEILIQGFSECFRVLKSNGVLIFKWNEVQIKVAEILSLTPEKPLFGNKSGKLQKTHWIAFLKK